MAVSLTTPTGQVVEAPTEEALASALASLLRGAEAEADLWLEDDDGWALSVVPSGDIFFENLDADEEQYLTLGPLPEHELLRLLSLLATGNVDALHEEAWEEGGL